jgi:hypothetical protein
MKYHMRKALAKCKMLHYCLRKPIILFLLILLLECTSHPGNHRNLGFWKLKQGRQGQFGGEGKERNAPNMP